MTASPIEPLSRYMRRQVPYWRTVGLKLLFVRGGRAAFSCAFRPGHLQNGVMHGGVIASLADSALACSALSRLYPEAYATTANFHIEYLRPVRAGTLTARARCLKAGRTILFCRCDVTDRTGSLVAAASSQLVRIPLPVPPRRLRR